MSPRRWDHPPPKTAEPPTLSHTHPVWIATWPPLSAQANGRAEQSCGLGLQEEKETGLQTTQVCLRRPGSPKLQGPEKGRKRSWGNLESKTKTLFHLNCLRHLSGRKRRALTLKESKSSFYPLQNEIECRWEINPLLSLPTHLHPISHQSPEASDAT